MADNITPEVNQEKLPVFVPPKTDLSLPAPPVPIAIPDVLNRPLDYVKLTKEIQKSPEKARDIQGQLFQIQQAKDKIAKEAETKAQQYTADVDVALQNQQREQANKIQISLQEFRKTWGHPEFHPTQDNISTLTGLFSLIGVIGTAMGGQGRMSAMGALNSMTGMMKGWQEGRKDLFDREKQKYDENFKRIQSILEDAKSDADQAMKLLAYDVQQAQAYAKQAAVKLNSQVANQILDSQSIDKFKSYVDGVIKDLQFAIKLQSEAATRNQPNYQLFVLADGRTVAVNTKNPNDVKEVPVGLGGATKAGAKGGEMKKDDAVKNYVSTAIGKPVDTSTALKLANSVDFFDKMTNMQQLNTKLGNVPGLTVSIANKLDSYVKSNIGADGKFDVNSLNKAFIDLQNEDKSFMKLSDNAKIMAKSQLDATMSYLRAKYGNRAPVSEFRAAQNVINRASASPTAFNELMKNEKKSTLDEVATLGYDLNDWNRLYGSIQTKKESFKPLIESMDVSPQPVNQNAVKHTLRGREIIPNASNTGWVFKDDGTPAK